MQGAGLSSRWENSTLFTRLATCRRRCPQSIRFVESWNTRANASRESLGFPDPAVGLVRATGRPPEGVPEWFGLRTGQGSPGFLVIEGCQVEAPHESGRAVESAVVQADVRGHAGERRAPVARGVG